MGRFPVLFILAGLVVGLWLGFNPTTHRELARWWTHTTSRSQATTPVAAIDLRQLDRRVSRFFRTEARPQNPTPSASSRVPGSSQISVTLQAFWHALVQFWLNLLAKLGISKT